MDFHTLRTHCASTGGEKALGEGKEGGSRARGGEEYRTLLRPSLYTLLPRDTNHPSINLFINWRITW